MNDTIIADITITKVINIERLINIINRKTDNMIDKAMIINNNESFIVVSLSVLIGKSI